MKKALVLFVGMSALDTVTAERFARDSNLLANVHDQRDNQRDNQRDYQRDYQRDDRRGITQQVIDVRGQGFGKGLKGVNPAYRQGLKGVNPAYGQVNPAYGQIFGQVSQQGFGGLGQGVHLKNGGFRQGINQKHHSGQGQEGYSFTDQVLNPAFDTDINQAGNIGNRPNAKYPIFNQYSATVLPGSGFGNRFDTPKYDHGINPTFKI